MTHEILNPETGDLIRETILIVIGLIIRWFERKKIKDGKL